MSLISKGLQIEFIKNGINALISPITHLLNEVVCLDLLSSFSQHIIHPIIKLRDILDPNNYMTISLGTPLPNL